ncbi:MAG TPA: hypothetical protein VG826_29130 [Pirellulales bacterium]|nr:hypothetical protein [Pirellulales bacterium]
MARMSTPNVTSLPEGLQTLLDGGLNGFALELFLESYAAANRPMPPPLRFVFRGVYVHLEPVESLEAAREFTCAQAKEGC